jgi:hypothetical protein
MVKAAGPYFRGFTRPQGAFTESAMGIGLQDMNHNSDHSVALEDGSDTRPILIVPYM